MESIFDQPFIHSQETHNFLWTIAKLKDEPNKLLESTMAISTFVKEKLVSTIALYSCWLTPFTLYRVLLFDYPRNITTI